MEIVNDVPVIKKVSKVSFEPISTVDFILASPAGRQRDNLSYVMDRHERNKTSLHVKTADYSAFVETMIHGVHLYIKRKEEPPRVLVWLGKTMKGFRAIKLFDSGKIIASKNREIIVLQLMKGTKRSIYLETIRFAI